MKVKLLSEKKANVVYDNTCYILGIGTMTWNVLLSDITFVSKKR